MCKNQYFRKLSLRSLFSRTIVEPLSFMILIVSGMSLMPHRFSTS